ncbi:MAG: hypothetical protein ACM3OF_11700 [Gemmatimonas sp.]
MATAAGATTALPLEPAVAAESLFALSLEDLSPDLPLDFVLSGLASPGFASADVPALLLLWPVEPAAALGWEPLAGLLEPAEEVGAWLPGRSEGAALFA